MTHITFIKKWKGIFANKAKSIDLAISGLFFIMTLSMVKYSGRYAESFTDAPAIPDLLHQILPLIDVGILATYGFLAVQLIFWVYFLCIEPEQLSYALKVYGIFLVFRSISIATTHLGAPAVRIDDMTIFNFIFADMYFTQDLFPSGHTALPFLGYLLIKKHKMIKNFMLLWSFVMATSVLLLHVHYSIDVIGAYFIAYGSVGLYKWLSRINVRKEWRLMQMTAKKTVAFLMKF